MLVPGKHYDHPVLGVVECLTVDGFDAVVRPCLKLRVTIPADPTKGRKERSFMARGDRARVSATSILKEVLDDGDPA